MFTENRTGPERRENHTESLTENRFLDRRARAQAIVRNAEHLLPEERALARAYFVEGMSASEVARLAGTTPKTVLRRIDRMVARVTSLRFVFAVNHRKSLGRMRGRVATACLVQGLSMRETSRRFGVSIYVVRSHLHAVNGMFDRITRD